MGVEKVVECNSEPELWLHRLKSLKGARPHNQMDADIGGDVGKPDNGPKLRNLRPDVNMDEVMEGLQRM